MDKYIVCLANSYKHGGRCIAGIEVEIQKGQLSIKKSTFGLPVWIRPISHSAAGEVPMMEALNINILSVVKLHGITYAGNAAHSEDYYYQKLETIDKINPSDSFLRKYADDWHQHIFGNRGRAVTPQDFMQGDYSLMLIRTEGCQIYLDERFTPKPRVKFSYKNTEYDFPITDPVFLDKLRANQALYKSGYDVVYIVASLGVEHEGWHSKLAATIIFPATNSIKEHVDIIESPINKTQSVNRNIISHQPEVSTKSAFKEHRLPDPIFRQSPITDFTKRNKEIEELNKILKNEDTYKRIQTQNQQQAKQGCYIATAVYESYNCPEVWVLRRFRDNVLALSWYGRLFIKVYYQISPYIVKKCGKSKLLKLIVKPTLDEWIKRLNRKGFSSTPYKDRI